MFTRIETIAVRIAVGRSAAMGGAVFASGRIDDGHVSGLGIVGLFVCLIGFHVACKAGLEAKIESDRIDDEEFEARHADRVGLERMAASPGWKRVVRR